MSSTVGYDAAVTIPWRLDNNDALVSQRFFGGDDIESSARVDDEVRLFACTALYERRTGDARANRGEVASSTTAISRLLTTQ